MVVGHPEDLLRRTAADHTVTPEGLGVGRGLFMNSTGANDELVALYFAQTWSMAVLDRKSGKTELLKSNGAVAQVLYPFYFVKDSIVYSGGDRVDMFQRGVGVRTLVGPPCEGCEVISRAVLAEREACAKVAESISGGWVTDPTPAAAVKKCIANAIRDRGRS